MTVTVYYMLLSPASYVLRLVYFSLYVGLCCRLMHVGLYQVEHVSCHVK